MSVQRIKKYLAAKIPWEYRCGVLVFRDGQFKACVIIDNEHPEDKKEIFVLLNMPYDTNYYTAKEISDAEMELYRNVVLNNTYSGKVPVYKASPVKGLETRSRLIQQYTLKLSSLDAKYVRKHLPKVITVQNELIQKDWIHCSELEATEYKLIKTIRKYFSSVITVDKDSSYNTKLEAFIVALKNY